MENLGKALGILALLAGVVGICYILKSAHLMNAVMIFPITIAAGLGTWKILE